MKRFKDFLDEATVDTRAILKDVGSLMKGYKSFSHDPASQGWDSQKPTVNIDDFIKLMAKHKMRPILRKREMMDMTYWTWDGASGPYQDLNVSAGSVDGNTVKTVIVKNIKDLT